MAIFAPNKPKINFPEMQEKQKPDEEPLRFSKIHVLKIFSLGAIMSLLAYIKLGGPSGGIFQTVYAKSTYKKATILRMLSAAICISFKGHTNL